MQEAAATNATALLELAKQALLRHPRAATHGQQPPTDAAAVAAAESDPMLLISAFASAQRSSLGSLPTWVDQKTERKAVWRKIGIPDYLIVPTHYAGEMLQVGVAEMPEFVDDGEGGFAPCLDEAVPVFRPADPQCQAVLLQLLRHHERFVLKPAVGANSRGVLLLSTTPEGVSIKSEAQLAGSAATGKSADGAANPARTLSAGEAAEAPAAAAEAVMAADNPLVWVGSPIKTWRSEGDLACLAYSRVWTEYLERNPLFRGLLGRADDHPRPRALLPGHRRRAAALARRA